MDRVFLDASVLFKAAYHPRARLTKLWKLPNTVLLTSAYAITEANRNLEYPEPQSRLSLLLQPVQVVSVNPKRPLPEGIVLPEKDVPILMAAIEAAATHLLTTDDQHFLRYFWQIIEGVQILPPSEYLKGKT